jgi:hypothetical protein
MPTLPVILASAVLCTAALACGGDDQKKDEPGAQQSAPVSASATPSAMTKDAYVSAVNAICTRVESEADKIDEPTTAKDYESALTTLIGIIDRAQTDIKALTPPAEDASALQENFIGPNDEQAARFKSALPSVQSAAAANDTAAAEKAFGDSLAEDNPQQDQWMTTYGLTACI